MVARIVVGDVGDAAGEADIRGSGHGCVDVLVLGPRIHSAAAARSAAT
ncbi:hypothetical protein DESC_870071 [Desulfosarcina cetonica]|nr:hypothetical protein DESC_870071 [Desulfosarcina cetonica]